MTALVDDNGNRTEWTYDCVGRRLTETKGINSGPTPPSAGTTIEYAYNADATLVTQTSRRVNVRDQRDARRGGVLAGGPERR